MYAIDGIETASAAAASATPGRTTRRASRYAGTTADDIKSALITRAHW